MLQVSRVELTELEVVTYLAHKNHCGYSNVIPNRLALQKYAHAYMYVVSCVVVLHVYR